MKVRASVKPMCEKCKVIRRGGAVLAATHNPEALRYANRVVLFRDGVVVQEGTPQEVAAHLTTD